MKSLLFSLLLMANAFVASSEKVGTTTSVTTTAAASGHTFILWVVSQRSPSARTVSSIGSHTNVTWTKLINSSSGHIDAEIWYGTVSGGTSGTSATITMSGTGATIAWVCREFSGVLTSGTIPDGTAVAKQGSSTAASTAAYSTGLANDLILACEGHEDGTAPSVQPGGSYTNCTFEANSTTCGVQGNYILAGTAGAQSATWTIDNVAWSTCLGALKVTPITSTLTSSMATFSASTGRGRLLAASAAAMAGAISRRGQKALAAATGSSAFKYSRSLTIDHTKVPSTQTNFPVLVSLSDATLKTTGNGGNVTNSSGYDINFFSDSALSSALTWEVESYDGTAGTLVAWVKIPSVSSASDTVFYVAYGNASISSFQSTASAVWDSHFKLVFHMADNAATTAVADSTSNGNNGTSVNNTSGMHTASGEIGPALTFNGSTDRISTSLALTFNTNTGGHLWTVEVWAKLTSGTGTFQMAAGNGGSTDELRTTGSVWECESNAASIDGAAESTGAWHHFVGEHDDTVGAYQTKFFFDGSQVGTTNTTNPNVNTTSAFAVGGRSSSFFWHGPIDEVRVSDMLRSPDWITAEYNNMNNPGNVGSAGFLTVGSQIAGGMFAGSILRGRTLGAGSSTMAASVVRSAQKPLAASMATFAGAFLRGRLLVASIATASAALSRIPQKVIAAGSATCDVVFSAIKQGGGLTKSFSAGMSTFSAAITRATLKGLNSSTATCGAVMAKLTSKFFTGA